MENEQVILAVDSGAPEQQAQTEAPRSAPLPGVEGPSRMQEDIRLFMRTFPEVKAGEIPQEVWGMVNQGRSLVEAWHTWQLRRERVENEELRFRLDAAEKNRRNRETALSSQQTSGAGKVVDRFVQALLSDD